MKAWRSVYPTDHLVDPDLGDRADDVMSLLLAMPRLATHCHDAAAAADYEAIVAGDDPADDDIRCAARDEAWHAAVLTGRRRVWQLVRRSGAESRDQYCVTCRQRQPDDETARVLTLCVDAACGLLVAGDLEDDIVDVLITPVRSLLDGSTDPPSES
jgi:hypothetical protein